MSVIKKTVGLVTFLLGCGMIANGFFSLPICNGIYEMIGCVGGGLLFGGLFSYFGWRWIRD